MVELSAFVDADVKILPLFYRLLPDDLKHKGNYKRWEKQWKEHAKKVVKQRIVVSKWANALSKLCSQNDVAFDANYGGEKTYLDKIMHGIHKTLPPAIKFNTCQIRGQDRLCKVILDKLKEMTKKITVFHGIQSCHLEPKVSVLGLYRLGGSGKSSLCKCLYNHFLPLYGPRKTLYLEMPSHPSRADVVNKFKELLKLTDFKDKMNLDKVSELEEIKDLQRHCFLIVSEGNIISVHDVYLEFAKSIQNDISKFMNSTRRWCWEAYEFTGAEKNRAIVQSNALELGIAWQMRNLQVVYLQNTGIEGLENVGSYWPHLQDLSVIEACLEALHLGNLPLLKRFRFSDHLTSNGDAAWPFSDDMPDLENYRLSDSWEYRKGNRRVMMILKIIDYQIIRIWSS